MIEMTRHVYRVLALWQWCNFSRMDVLDFVYLYTRTQSIQKQMVEYHVKSKYPGEYSTFDKVGRGAKEFESEWINALRFSEYLKQFLKFYAKIDSIFYYRFTLLYLIPRFSQLLRAFAEKSEVGLHSVCTWDINHFLSTTRHVCVADMLRKTKFNSIFETEAKTKFKSVFKHNKPLAPRGHVTNASLKQWLEILHPKFEIFQQSSMICIGYHVGGHTLALQNAWRPKLLFACILLNVW